MLQGRTHRARKLEYQIAEGEPENLRYTLNQYQFVSLIKLFS